MHRSSVLVALAAAMAAASAFAADIRVQCYSDGNECEVTADLAKRFEAQQSRHQGDHRQGALQGGDRYAARPARGRRRSRHRARHRSRRAQQVLPRSHAAARCAREVLGGQLRADAQVAARGAVGQGHLRDDDAAHGHGAVRQQDAVRAGQGADARGYGDVGRLDGGGEKGRDGDEDAVRDGDGPQRPSLRAARGGVGREDLRRLGHADRRRRVQGGGRSSSSTGTRPD